MFPQQRQIACRERMLPDELDALARAPSLKADQPSPPAAHALPGWRVGATRFGLIRMSLLALVVGMVTGLGAFAFRELIGLVHNLLFLRSLSFAYDSSLFTPINPWGPLVILVPVVGAIGVTFIVSKFAPEAKGHGVPEVMDAIYYGGGVIRPVVAVAKSLASAVAIGSGAAVGREGPIIQIGSALGSTFGQMIAMPPGQRITLVAAGAGAGIAATFNTPIGGVLFAIELMMPEVSVEHVPAGRDRDRHGDLRRPAVLRPAARFHVPHDSRRCPTSRRRGVDSGALCRARRVIGVAAAAFIRGLHLAEDVFDKIPGRYLRHMLGMLLVGVLIYALLRDVRPLLTSKASATRRSRRFSRPAAGRRASGPAVRLQAAGDLDQPRLGLVGRHLLAVAVYGRDLGRRLRRAAVDARCPACRSACRPSRWSAWARWSAAAPARR